VVAGGVDVVPRAGPAVSAAVPVCPEGDSREVTRRVAAALTFGAEDGADTVQNLWFEARLGDGGDDFVACCLKVTLGQRGVHQMWE
jgi:hypothetical protein